MEGPSQCEPVCEYDYNHKSENAPSQSSMSDQTTRFFSVLGDDVNDLNNADIHDDPGLSRNASTNANIMVHIDNPTSMSTPRSLPALVQESTALDYTQDTGTTNSTTKSTTKPYYGFRQFKRRPTNLNLTIKESQSNTTVTSLPESNMSQNHGTLNSVTEANVTHTNISQSTNANGVLSATNSSNNMNHAILTTPSYVLVFKQLRTTTRLYFYEKSNIHRPVTTVKEFKCTSFTTLCVSKDGNYLFNLVGPRDMRVWRINRDDAKLSLHGEWQLAEPQGEISSACWPKDLKNEVLIGTERGLILSINIDVPHIVYTLPLNNSFSPVEPSKVVSIAPCPFASRIYAVSYESGKIIIYDGSKQVVDMNQSGDTSIVPFNNAHKTLHVIDTTTTSTSKNENKSNPIYSLSWHRSSNPHHQALAGVRNDKIYVWSVNLGHSVKRIRSRHFPEQHQSSPYTNVNNFCHWYKNASLVRASSLGIVVSYVANKQDLTKVVVEAAPKQIMAVTVEPTEDRAWFIEAEYLKCVNLQSGKTVDQEDELEFVLWSDFDSLTSPVLDKFPQQDASIDGYIGQARSSATFEKFNNPEQSLASVANDHSNDDYSYDYTAENLQDKSYSSTESLGKVSFMVKDTFDLTLTGSDEDSDKETDREGNIYNEADVHGQDEDQDLDDQEVQFRVLPKEYSQTNHQLNSSRDKSLKDKSFKDDSFTDDSPLHSKNSGIATPSSSVSYESSVQALNESLGNLSSVELGFKQLGLLDSDKQSPRSISPTPIRIPARHPSRSFNSLLYGTRATRATVDWEYYMGQYDQYDNTAPSLQDDTDRGDEPTYLSEDSTPVTSPLDLFFRKSVRRKHSAVHQPVQGSAFTEDLFID